MDRKCGYTGSLSWFPRTHFKTSVQFGSVTIILNSFYEWKLWDVTVRCRLLVVYIEPLHLITFICRWAVNSLLSIHGSYTRMSRPESVGYVCLMIGNNHETGRITSSDFGRNPELESLLQEHRSSSIGSIYCSFHEYSEHPIILPFQRWANAYLCCGVRTFPTYRIELTRLISVWCSEIYW